VGSCLFTAPQLLPSLFLSTKRCYTKDKISSQRVQSKTKHTNVLNISKKGITWMTCSTFLEPPFYRRGRNRRSASNLKSICTQRLERGDLLVARNPTSAPQAAPCTFSERARYTTCAPRPQPAFPQNRRRLNQKAPPPPLPHLLLRLSRILAPATRSKKTRKGMLSHCKT
jgi:hypothetical protein